MFLNALSSLEIGLLAGGGALLLAVIVVLLVVLCRQCGSAEKRSPDSRNQRRQRKLSSTHSTIDLPPLLVMDSIGDNGSCSVMGMIDNPLKAFPCDGDSKASCCTHISDTLTSKCKSVESLAVPRSPREFMYYMRSLEQTRSQSGLNRVGEVKTKKIVQEVHDVRLFAPGLAVAEARENVPPKRKTSGALRNPAYRELMQGNSSFHVVCTSPCIDSWSDDSDSEPEIHEPKARLKFTTILEEQVGSTGSNLNIASTTPLPPTYHETLHARSMSDEQTLYLNERL